MKKFDYVLGGGGSKGAGHAGFLKAAQECGIELGKGTGVSIGSVVLAFYTNGYSPETICSLLQKHFGNLQSGGGEGTARLRWPTADELLQGEFIDLLPIFRDIVKTYNLQPNENMQIVAFDIVRAKPKVFSGCNYDLAKALSASCSLPGVMRPVVDGDFGELKSWNALLSAYRKLRKAKNGAIYFDGYLYHPFAFDFSAKPVLISKLGLASEIHQERWYQLSNFDRIFHLLEMILPNIGMAKFRMPQTGEALVVETGLPDVSSAAWNLPLSVHTEMFEHALQKSRLSFSMAKKAGLL